MRTTTKKTTAYKTERELNAARAFAAATENVCAIVNCLAVNENLPPNSWGFADKIGRVNDLLAEARRLLGAV